MVSPVAVAGARQDADRTPGGRAHLVPWLAAAVVVLGRLPHAASALGIDESGFLLVGGQWGPGGRALYGDYFVDRPPLLLSVYQVAAALGGAIPLRVIGALAGGVAVLATGHAARRAAGSRAGAVSALLVAALMLNPLAGTREVNGELLAAPLTALAMAGGVELVVATARARFLGAVIAGAGATAAVLVKQNMLDAWVFLFFLALVTFRGTSVRQRGLAALGLGLGASATVALTALWTGIHGTSLRGVVSAMYPFRWQAAHVLAHTPSDAAGRRTVALVGLAAASGLVLLLAALLCGAAAAWRGDRGSTARGRGVRSAVLLACVPTAAYGVASIMAGGSYWSHYLVEVVVPLGLGAGVAVGPWAPRVRLGLVGLLGASALVGALGQPASASSEGERVGEAIRAVSAPGDTIVTIWGHSDVDYTSGLRSPYPQLWSLPTRTLDPRLDLLTHTLESPGGPTWLVVWPHLSHSAVDTSRLEAAVVQHYRAVAVCTEWTVYLHDGTRRPAPDVCPRARR